MDEAERADRVVLLHQGRVRAEGTPAELIATVGVDSLAGAFAQLTEGGGRATPDNPNPKP